MISIVQLAHRHQGRRTALVEGEHLRLLSASSTVALAEKAFTAGTSLAAAARDAATPETIPYDPVLNGNSHWRLLPPIDHPAEPARCMVAGTGLTHRASADNRNAMHADPPSGEKPKPSDSIVMYQWGVEGGRPAPGEIGASPEWFFKGCGSTLRAHNQPLTIPSFGEDGGEEAEIAGVYWIDSNCVPRRLGFTQGNEFSDHIFEKKNYLYLASSKLRECSIGPELVLDRNYDDIAGQVRILRGNQTMWQKSLRTGESAMCHSLANMEHHHFKFPAHRRPGDVHVHFFGAGAFSFGAGIKLQTGDIMEVSFDGMGKPLRNPLAIDSEPNQLVTVSAL